MIAKSQRWQLTAVAAAALMGLWGTHANALSLGRVNVQSSLGEPLKAEIEILDINAEEAATLNARVAPPEAFKTAGLDYNAAMTSLQATLQRRANGRAYLRLISDRAINEPFVDMILEASWSTGRIVRDYTMLFDPPNLRNPGATVVAPAQAPLPAKAPLQAQAPLTASVQPATPARTASPAAPSPATQVKPVVAAKPQPQQDATRKQQIVVKAGETAGRIAAVNKPANVSLDQMLVAMLRANPDAFMGDNVNRMKAGALVTLPSEAQAMATAPAEARQIIIAQSGDFNAFRRKLASSAPTTQVTPASREVAGKLQATVEDKKPSATTPDKLTLSKGAVTAKASEDQLAQSRNAKESANRAAELAKNLQDLNKLAAASSAGAAASQAKPAQMTLPGVSAPQPALPAASAVAPAAVAATTTVVAPTPAAASASAAASAPAKPVSQAAPALPAPSNAPSFVDGLLEDPLVPAGALGLIALLAGLAFYKARQRKAAASQDSTFGESRLQSESFFGNSGGQNVDTNDHAATGSSMIYSPSQLDAVDDVDPVAEADVYLAYGRDLQAEEILKDALRTRPERLAIHQKLLEIYAKRRDAKSFEAIATLAFNLTNGVGQEWAHICERGLALDPDNALYLPGGQPLAETAVATSPASIDTVLPDLQTDQHTLSASPTRSAEGTSDLDLDLDFSLDEPDLPDSPFLSKADTSAPYLTASQTATESPPLTMSDHEPWSVPGTLEAAAPPELDDHDSVSGKLDFDMPSMAADNNADAFDKTQVLSVPSIQENFDKTQVLSVPSMQEKPAADSGMMEFDLGSLSLDFDTVKTSELVNASDAASPHPADLDDEPTTQGGGFYDVADDPLETKLALADEFKAIGDDDGARALIEEVISEATGEMKTKAQRALNSL